MVVGGDGWWMMVVVSGGGANALQTQENEPMVDTVIETPVVVATPVVVEAPAMVETPAMVVAPVVELYDEYCSPLPSPSDDSAMEVDSDEEPLVPAWSACACRPALAAQPSAPDAQASAPDAQASAPEAQASAPQAQASASEAQASASEAQAMAPIAQAMASIAQAPAPGASSSAAPSAEELLQRAIDEQKIVDENYWVDCSICKKRAQKGTCRILLAVTRRQHTAEASDADARGAQSIGYRC